MKKNRQGYSMGFTMIEMLVASAIFLTVISITTATFLINIRTQRYLLASINGTENISYALEVMGREIRMGKNFFSPSDDSLSFLNTKNQAIIYRLNNEQIERSIAGQPFRSLTSPDVRVINLRFLIRGDKRDDGEQVRVIVLLKIASYAGIRQLETNLETTLSSRQPET